MIKKLGTIFELTNTILNGSLYAAGNGVVTPNSHQARLYLCSLGDTPGFIEVLREQYPGFNISPIERWTDLE